MEAQPTPDEMAETAERMIAEMRSQGVKGNIAYDRDNQRLISESTESVSVQGLAILLRGAPASERGRLTTRYLLAHLRGRQAPERWEEARGRVLPRVGTELEHSCWSLRSRLEGIVVPARPTAQVSEHLRMLFVWELEDSVATVTAADVERWGVSLDDLQDAAADNLLARTPRPVQWLASPESQGVYRSKWRDGFDATRVVALQSAESIPAMGPLVAIATSDSDVFLADSTNEAALFQLGLACQRQMAKSGQMLWLWPLLLDGEERRHWLPDPSSSAFPPLSTCAAGHATTVHKAHGDLLQRVLELDASPMRVGAVGYMQSPLGESATVAVWKDGAPAAIAKADYVRLERGEELLVMAPWSRIMEVLGHTLEEMPGYPTRYRAMDFPEDWQIAQVDAKGS